MRLAGAAALLNERIAKEGIDLKILFAAEVRLTPDTLDYLSKEDFLCFNANKRYFLMEFPNRLETLPKGWEYVLGNLFQAGYRPLIAHPERNFYFLKNPYKLIRAVKSGALLQLTAQSVTGAAGGEAQEFLELPSCRGACSRYRNRFPFNDFKAYDFIRRRNVGRRDNRRG